MMTMIFRYITGIVFFLFVSVLYADVTVNNVEKDAKVINNISTSQTESVIEVLSVKQWPLRAEQWELARSGESILSLPVLKAMMSEWLNDKAKVIEIRYPGGEEGELWVQELMDWLVSLGIPSNHMTAVPGSGADDVIKIFLVK